VSQLSSKSLEYSSKTWKTLTQWLHSKKDYKPEYLAEPEPRAAIDEICRILSTPLKNLSVKQEIPAELTAALENNIFFFSGFKTHHELVEASKLLKDENGNFKPFKQFLKDVEKIDDTYNRNYLNAEYNFATASSQMAVKWKEWEADGDDYDLQYRTAGDDRVREEHAALNGITLPQSDPFWKSYLPPNGWNCRCTTVQVRKGKYPQSDSEKAIARGNAMTDPLKKQIFRFNPGAQEKIFPPKHPYYKAPEIVKQVLEKIVEKTAATIEREKYLKEMEILLDKKVVKRIDGGSISIGFTKKGNKHLYSDTIMRVEGVSKNDLKKLNTSLRKSVFVKSAELSKKRKDDITKFYYFKDKNKELYYNVAERVKMDNDGRYDISRFLYSITNSIKK